MARILKLGFFMVLAIHMQAQLPNTQIYTFDFTDGSEFKLYNTKFLSFDNKTGYNNQPTFIGDELYYTRSFKKFGKEQTDIVALDVKNKLKSQVTKSLSSEYSPTLCPDRKHFSVVRAFENGVQQLWKLPLDRQDTGEALFPQITNIGYHCWMNEYEVALFLVDEEKGHELVIGDLRTGDITHVSFNVGRCLMKSPKGNLIYVHKVSDTVWQLKSRNIQTDETVLLTQTLPETEDYAIMPDGRIITGYDGHLYRLEPQQGNEWISLIRVNHIIDNKEITRIAVKKGKIAIVAKI